MHSALINPRIFSFPFPSSTTLPVWLEQPVTPQEVRFHKFHHEHPEVFRELVERARIWMASVPEGAKPRLSISMLVETMRYDRILSGLPPVKMGNSFRSLYARLLLATCPWLDGIIQIRTAPALFDNLQRGY